MTLVVDGIKLCCGQSIGVEKRIEKFKFEVCPRQVRKLPKSNERKFILDKQKNKCFYCNLQFGTPVWNSQKTRIIFLKLNWDHIIPFCYNFNNKPLNFVASCHICNQLKSSKYFDSIEMAKRYVKEKWLLRKYDPIGKPIFFHDFKDTEKEPKEKHCIILNCFNPPTKGKIPLLCTKHHRTVYPLRNRKRGKHGSL